MSKAPPRGWEGDRQKDRAHGIRIYELTGREIMKYEIRRTYHVGKRIWVRMIESISILSLSILIGNKE
jgi:hypothetical protein